MKSIYDARAKVAIATILMAGLLLLGVLLVSLWPKAERTYHTAETYADPGSERVLEVRRWSDNQADGAAGWDFVLCGPDGTEQLLERTHALAWGAITQVNWRAGEIEVITRAPSGTLALQTS